MPVLTFYIIVHKLTHTRARITIAQQTAEFFKERVARQEAHRAMRVAMEAERNRLVAPSPSPSDQQQQQSVVRSWAELRAKHQRECAVLARKFREEHDWCVASCVCVRF